MQLVYTSASQLASALSTHAVELVFKRRIMPPSKAKFGVAYTSTRRMFATNCKPFLNSSLGSKIFEYNDAKPSRVMFEGGLRYDPRQRGLVCAFDLFWLEYRMISAESCGIVTMEESEFSKQILEEMYNEVNLGSAIESPTPQAEWERLTGIKPTVVQTQIKSLLEQEKRKKQRAKLQLPMSLKTEEEQKLFWIYWKNNLQPKSVSWKLAFENK